jgi:hypothetical protein
MTTSRFDNNRGATRPDTQGEFIMSDYDLLQVIDFVKNLPSEISYVISENSEERTITIGREYILNVLKGEQNEKS